LNNPVRVKAAQEARRLAGIASAAASDARASALGVRSSRTDRPDGMGMNIAGGYEQVKKEAAALDISADEYSKAKRGDAGFFSAAASDARASALGVRSSRTDRPDGLGLRLSGGSQKLQQDAAKLQIPIQDKMESDRLLAQMAGTEAAALAGRGRSNLNRGTPRNDAVLKLGEQIGSAVMGKKDWAKYILTSTKDMPPQDKPFTSNETNRSAQSRPADERDGWVFLPEKRTVSQWRMTDEITYRLPDHTEYKQSFRAAISQAYHRSWDRHSRMERQNQRDKDAGKLLPRGQR